LTQTPYNNQYGKTKRTWTFSEPQGASRSEAEIKSKNEASTAAAREGKLRERRSRD